MNSLEMASSGAAFELELEPGEPAASWAYVMAMQTSKRGRGSAGFWYDDWHVAVYARDEARGAWAHVAAAAGAREDAQTEVMFEPGVRYLVRAYSFARETRAQRGEAANAATAPRRYHSGPTRNPRRRFACTARGNCARAGGDGGGFAPLSPRRFTRGCLTRARARRFRGFPRDHSWLSARGGARVRRRGGGCRTRGESTCSP